MAIVKKIKRLQDELNDLQRLIDIDSQLVEKYPEDSFLKMSLQQYLDRKTTLQTKLRLEILNQITMLKAFGAYKDKNNSGRDVMIDSPSTIDQKQMNELKIKTVL